MFPSRASVAFGLPLILLATACPARVFDMKTQGDVSVAVSSEDLRVTVIGKRSSVTDGGKVMTRTVACVEPVGPAMMLQNFNARGAISALGSTGVNANSQGSYAGAPDAGPTAQGQFGVGTLSATDIRGDVALATTQTMAQIYEVDDIMQFVQQMSFRYCEAYANGTMDDATYLKSMLSLERTAKDLLRTQMAMQAGAALPGALASEKAAADQATTSKQQCLNLIDDPNAPDTVCNSVDDLKAYLKTHEPAEAKGAKGVSAAPTLTADERAQRAQLFAAVRRSTAAQDNWSQMQGRSAALQRLVSTSFGDDAGAPEAPQTPAAPSHPTPPSAPNGPTVPSHPAAPSEPGPPAPAQPTNPGR